MTSYPPDADRITTEDLITAVRQQTGYAPTQVQLRYLVRHGLLAEPQHEYPGRGHGQGSVAWWDAETLPRLRLIARTRTGSKGKNISLKLATRLLVIKGYMPTDPQLLRDVLHDFLDDFIAQYQLNRPFLKHPTSDVRQRLVDSLKRRSPQITEPARGVFSQFTAFMMGFPHQRGASSQPALPLHVTRCFQDRIEWCRRSNAPDSLCTAGRTNSYWRTLA